MELTIPQAIDRHPPIYRRLYFQVLLGIVLGILVGWLRPDLGVRMKPLGDAFIKLIRMVIAPIIFGTVVVGIAKMGDMKEVGRIGVKALIIGLLVINLAQPGAGVNASASTLDPKAVASFATSAQHLTVVEFLMNI